jgi:replicative DNA helicase
MKNTRTLERAIIGCILMNGELFALYRGILSNTDFNDELCNSIYKVMTLLEYKGVSIDPVLVVTELSALSGLNIDEHNVYELANEAPSEKLYEDYVNELIEIRGEEFTQRLKISEKEAANLNREEK